MNQLPIMVLEGCSYVGASLYRLCVPNAFGGRAGFEMDVTYIFPQGTVAAITFIGRGAGDEGARAGIGCEVGLPLCSVAKTALSGVRSNPKLLEQKP